MGLTAEKDAGEPFFCKYNKKGYDFYSAYFFLQDVKKLKSLAIGNYRVSFGYGLVINTGGFSFGKSGSLGTMNGLGGELLNILLRMKIIICKGLLLLIS